MPAPKFNLEDVVYYVKVTWTEKSVTCPDCLGERRWEASLPNGEEMHIACPSCHHGYEGCRGTISDWDFHAHVFECEVAGMTKTATGFEYVVSDLRHNVTCHVDETELYFDRDEAVAVGKAEVIRVEQAKRAHDAKLFASKRKDRVGGMTAYFRKEIREAKKRIASAEKGLAEINAERAITA